MLAYTNELPILTFLTLKLKYQYFKTNIQPILKYEKMRSNLLKNGLLMPFRRRNINNKSESAAILEKNTTILISTLLTAG